MVLNQCHTSQEAAALSYWEIEPADAALQQRREGATHAGPWCTEVCSLKRVVTLASGLLI